MISVILSGASTGLGASLYRQLSQENVIITVIGRSSPNDMREQDCFIQMNFADEIQFNCDADKDVSKVVFISNAGSIEPIDLARNISMADFKENHMINFYAPYAISIAITKMTQERNIPFNIVNISTGASQNAIAGWSAYCSSKSAIKIALDCIAEENDHVGVVHLDPGVVDTNMQKKIRNSSLTAMPNRQKFINYFHQGLLKDPQIAALEIAQSIKEFYKLKIALLSDIHANIDAFELVLRAIDTDGIDAIFIAGDLVGYYYHPDQVINICMSRDDIYCIRGNHDRNFLNALNDKKLMANFIAKYGSSYRITQEKLSDKQVTWLGNLPEKLEFELDQKTLSIAHGSIHSEDEYVYPSQTNLDLIQHLSDSKYTILGHTHHPFAWCNEDRWLINPGSVGQPRDQSAVSSYFYLDLKNDVLMPKRVQFPIKKLLTEIGEHDPNNEYLRRVLTRNSSLTY